MKSLIFAKDEQKLQLQRELDAKPGAKTGCATGTKEGDAFAV